MAKIIRCPNCGENVEIPPNPTGQIVTCIACGTAMRLKSRKDAAQPKLDPAEGSMSGSLSGSMTATRITDQVQASSDDPPSLGGECEICGNPTDPDDLVEDRGHLKCRSCLKLGSKVGGKMPRPLPPSDDGLIPFKAPDMPVRRSKLFTFGMPFFVGCAAMALYVACDLFLAFNPKPVGQVAAKPGEPAPSTESAWDREHRPVIEKMLGEASALRADPAKGAEALAKYEAIIALAKGQQSGSLEVRRLVDQAEREVETLKSAAVASPPLDATAGETPAPEPTPPATPPEEQVAANIPSPAPPAPPVVVPEDTAPRESTVFTNPEDEVLNYLTEGMAALEATIGQSSEMAAEQARQANLHFSNARGVLTREKRNVPGDPAWELANHGAVVAYIHERNFPLAKHYMKQRLAPLDRAATINQAVIYLHEREEKAETIRMLLKLLEADPESEDAYVVNLLGTALGRYADETIQQEKELRDAKNAYTAIVKRMSDRHPGERRWGVRWVSVREFEDNLRESARQKNELAKLEQILRTARNRIEDYSRNPQKAAAVQTARDDEQRAIQEIAALRAKMTTEEWLTPEQIVPVLPDVAALNARSRDGGGGSSAATTQPKPDA